MGSPRFRLLPHTADVRLAVYGQSQEELLRHLALGLVAFVLGYLPRGRASAYAQLILPEDDPGAQLVRLGNEVLYWLFTRRQQTVDLTCEGSQAQLHLRPLPRHRQLPFEIKAVTFHALQPRRDSSRLRAVLTLDL